MLTVGFTVFAAAAIGGGVLLWRGQSSPNLQRATATGGADPTGQLDMKTRVATIGSASMKLPDAPYRVMDSPMTLSGTFDVVFSADAPVHRLYNGTDSWWSSVLFGRLPAPAEPDLRAQAQAVVDDLSRQIFGGQPTTLRDLSSSTHTVDGCRGVLISVKVGYDITRVPSRYDTLTAMFVELNDSSVIVALSSVPNDSPDELVRQANTALRTLTVH